MPFRMAEDSDAVVQVVMDLHVTDCQEPVEPGVGNGLHHLIKAISGDPCHQTVVLLGNGARKGFSF